MGRSIWGSQCCSACQCMKLNTSSCEFPPILNILECSPCSDHTWIQVCACCIRALQICGPRRILHRSHHMDKGLLSGGWENKRGGDTVSHLDGIIFNAAIDRVIELCILLSFLTRQRSVQWVISELVSFIFQGWCLRCVPVFLANMCLERSARCSHVITNFTLVDIFQCNYFTLKWFDHFLHFINFGLKNCEKVRCALRFGNEVLVAAEVSKLAKVVEWEELAELRVPLSASLWRTVCDLTDFLFMSSFAFVCKFAEACLEMLADWWSITLSQGDIGWVKRQDIHIQK